MLFRARGAREAAAATNAALTQTDPFAILNGTSEYRNELCPNQ
jgi:hypothetical protein